MLMNKSIGDPLSILFSFSVSYTLYHLYVLLEPPCNNAGCIGYGYTALYVIPLLSLILMYPIYRLLKAGSIKALVMKIIGFISIVLFLFFLIKPLISPAY